MIGMMYLFLTALLALNVSKEIINAFVIINKGIEETNSNFSSKLSSQYAIFKGAYDKNPGKAQAYWDAAQKVRAEAAKTIAYLTELKGRMVAQSEDGDQDQYKTYVGKDRNGEDTLVRLDGLSKKDDFDSPTYLLVGSDPSSPSDKPFSGLDMVKTVTNFKNVLKQACAGNPDIGKRFDESFAFKPGIDPYGKEEPWVVLNFYHNPVVASIAVLSKVQADVKNAESEAIEYLLSKIDASDIKISKIVPVVSVKSNFIAVGDSLVAQISVGAIDTTKDPIITVQGRAVKMRGGIGYLSERPTSLGEQVWKGIIKYETPAGPVDLPFEIPFKVAASTDAVVDPTAMNVLYPGLENPIAVSVPGADSDNLILSSNSSKIRIVKVKSGQYNIIPEGTFAPREEVVISVSGKTSTGGSRNFGTKKFRIKPLPKPEALFAGKGPSDNDVSMGALKDASRMTAILRDFVFDGVKYKIVSFTLTVPAAGGDIPFNSNSDELTPAMKEQIGKMRAKQKISFTDIKAVGPDRQVKLLNNLTFKIK